MKILSLFDGISCGRLALERAGIQVEAYYASEIDKDAISAAQMNYPDIIQIGDVRFVSYDSQNGILHTENGDIQAGAIDLLIGGSPCTNFSSIGYANGMVSEGTEILTLDQYLSMKAQGASFEGQSYLFWEYIRILDEVRPKYFLLENVKMASKWEKILNDSLKMLPIKINSSLVSAQNRPRLYWTNIQGISAPEDKCISLRNILDDDADTTDVSHCQTIQLSFPKLVQRYGYVPESFNAYNITEITDKAPALSRGSMVTSSCAVTLFAPVANGKHTVKNGMLDNKYPTKLTDGQYNLRRLSIKEMERLQTLPDGYVDKAASSSSKKGNIIGNGWTVDIISHIFSFMPH
jgi:DNA (cytosine-5)-methyltransferase 3A